MPQNADADTALPEQKAGVQRQFFLLKGCEVT